MIFELIYDLIFELIYDLIFELIYDLIFELIYDLIFSWLQPGFPGSSATDSPMNDAGIIVDPATKLLVFARIIHAIYDVAPYTEGATPEPFLYREDGLSAADAIIKRYVLLS